MFDRYDTRFKIAIVWVVAFLGIWSLFQSYFPIKSMKQQLNQIEESIDKKDWVQAKENASRFKENFRRNRIFIQMNNATEAFTVFEQNIGQLETSVKHKQDSALEYVGALREAIDLVIKPFSGP
ncbi:DUF4363 family protein [Clostridium swellfunianum]|uniref:DUF4363 family protein n=1 Tax=Clostridium swellfunianum TaxID=1367462 RepID=UPI00202E06E2|nr:DUF4363 family protein [Clostridium swellfunianum]MCM0649638.1 DUF4363 family protein [Clostridium swellfunianum]